MTELARTASAGTFRAGTARVEITPPLGTHLAGSGSGLYRPVRVVLDPLFACAVVFELAGRKLCFLSLDAMAVAEDCTQRIQRKASERTGIDPAAVMVHATQNHSAPSLGNFMLDQDFPAIPDECEYLRGGETAYTRLACERAIEAIVRANASLSPARIAAGSAMREGLAFNRRAITRQGSGFTPLPYPRSRWPLGRTDLRYIEGPSDPEIGVLCAQSTQGKMITAVLHFTCHPVHACVRDKFVASAGWPGLWAGLMGQRLDMDCMPLVLNGCCGDQNPWSPFEADVVLDERRMSESLAETGLAVVETLKFEGATTLDWRATRVCLPLKAPDAERVKKAEAMLTSYPQPRYRDDAPGQVDPAWFAAAAVMSVEYMRRRTPKPECQIQAFRVGHTAFVSLPGEPFVSGQLRIKMASPFARTFVAHNCGQYIGYIPTREALEHGGHEVNFSYWARHAPECMDILVATASLLLRELFDGAERGMRIPVPL